MVCQGIAVEGSSCSTNVTPQYFRSSRSGSFRLSSKADRRSSSSTTLEVAIALGFSRAPVDKHNHGFAAFHPSVGVPRRRARKLSPGKPRIDLLRLLPLCENRKVAAQRTAGRDVVDLSSGSGTDYGHSLKVREVRIAAYSRWMAANIRRNDMSTFLGSETSIA